MAVLNQRAGRLEDAAGHLQEALQTAARAGSRGIVLIVLDCCGLLRATTGRRAEALTLWAAHAAVAQHEGFTDSPADAPRRQEP